MPSNKPSKNSIQPERLMSKESHSMSINSKLPHSRSNAISSSYSREAKEKPHKYHQMSPTISSRMIKILKY